MVFLKYYIRINIYRVLNYIIVEVEEDNHHSNKHESSSQNKRDFRDLDFKDRHEQ